MAHRLTSGLSPKCETPHGHNEYIEVFLKGKEDVALDLNANMVMLFEKSKGKWHRFIDDFVDHALQLNVNDPLIGYFEKNEKEKLARILTTLGDPTTEMLSACLMSKLQAFLDGENLPLDCTKILLEETPTNMVCLEGVRAFSKYLPPTNQEKLYWWERDDFTINDFAQNQT